VAVQTSRRMRLGQAMVPRIKAPSPSERPTFASQPGKASGIMIDRIVLCLTEDASTSGACGNGLSAFLDGSFRKKRQLLP